MGLTATAAAAAAAGFAAAGDALTSVTLQLNPSTGAVDPATDVAIITWGQNTAGIAALAYNDQKIGDKIGQQVLGEQRTRTFLVLGASVTVTDPDQEGQIVQGSTTWQIAGVETDPTSAIFIFHCIT